LVEHTTENRGVAGSIPALAIHSLLLSISMTLQRCRALLAELFGEESVETKPPSDPSAGPWVVTVAIAIRFESRHRGWGAYLKP
jgi:hypothetical protein